MGLFDAKLIEAEKSIARLEALLENKEDEVKFLRNQVEKLQEALYAKESPVAYQQIKMDEAAAEAVENLDPEEEARRRQEIAVYKRLAVANEEPLFESADELISALTQVVGPPKSDSIHENSES